MKKILLAFLCFILVSPISANYFLDVSSDVLEYGAIDRLSNEGIINGYSDGSFRGSNKVTRAELAKIFLVGAKKPIKSGNFTTIFYDIASDAWFYDYVHTAAEEGIVSGYPQGAFMPLEEVNTAEFLKMLVETFDLPKNELYSYMDVNTNDWFSQYAGIAQSKMIFPLRTLNSLEPERSITRYEVVYALDKILNGTDAEVLDIDYEQEVVLPSGEPNYKPIAETTSAMNCTVQSSQLCIEDKTLYQDLSVTPGMLSVTVAQYRIFSPESNGRFASFEILTNANPTHYPVFWLEQNGQELSSKKMLTGSRLELSMDKNRFDLGTNLPLTLKMDVPAGMTKNDFIKVRLLYLDNVWQNQMGDIGPMVDFGGKSVVK